MLVPVVVKGRLIEVTGSPRTVRRGGERMRGQEGDTVLG